MNTAPRLTHRFGTFLLLAGMVVHAQGDQVQTTTGDRYTGNIITFTNSMLVLKSDVLGLIRIPRAKLASVSFGNVPVSSNAQPMKAVSVPANALDGDVDKDTQKMLARLQSHTNLMVGVQSKFLGDAGAEANNKFSQMVSGLLSGNLSVGDIRAEAAAAASQLRAAKKELGEESSFAVDSYLAILDRFLVNSGSVTNR